MLKQHSRSSLTTLARRRSAKSSRLLARCRRREIEQLEVRQVLTGGLTITPISNQTLQAGAPLQLPINITDTSNTVISYSVTSSNPAIQATVRQSHEYLKLHVTHASSGANDPAIDGYLILELFPDAAPDAVAQIVSLVNRGYYNGLEFTRVDSGSSVIQTNSGNTTGIPTINNEITTSLRYSSTGVLGMARQSADGTNQDEFFITTAATPGFDYRYTIFGQLVAQTNASGAATNLLAQIASVAVNGTQPVSPVTITSATITDDPNDVALALSTPLGTTGTSTITVTANDGHGGTDTKQFTVTVNSDAGYAGPFLGPISPVTAVVNQQTTFQVPFVDQYSQLESTNSYAPYFLPRSLLTTGVTGDDPFPSEQVTVNENLNTSTGLITVTPTTVGVTPLYAGVVAAPTTNPNANNFAYEPSTNIFPLFVDPAAPTSVSLVASSDTGSSNSDNLTDLNNADSGHELQFLVSGVTAGYEVDILDGSTVIGSAVVPTGATSVMVTTNGSTSLIDGAHSITARQADKNVSYSVGNYSGTTDLTSANSTAISLTVDATKPTFTSPTPPATILSGASYAYTAQATGSALGSPMVYSIAAGPSGMSIDPSTGIVTWNPGDAEVGNQSIQIKATDQAGNSSTLAFTVNVLSPPSLGLINNQTIGPGQLLSFTAQATDLNPADTFTYSLGSAPPGASINPTTGAFTWTPSIADANESGTIQINVVDSFGQTTSGGVNVTVTANVPPTLEAIGQQTGYAFTNLTFTAQATDPNPQDTFTYSLASGSPDGASINPTTGAFTWTPTVAQAGADYTIEVDVVDAAGLTDAIDVPVHINQPVPPVLQALNPVAVYFGSTATLTASASDSNPNDVISYSLGNDAPAGVTIDPQSGLITFEPTASQAPGDYSFTVTATNAASLTDSTTAEIDVLAAVAPSLGSIGSQTVTAGGAAATFTASATDVNPQDTFVYSLGSGAPSGATIDPASGVFHWAPTAAQALQTYDISVVVTEAGGLTDTQTAEITVRPPAPSIAPIADQQIQAGGAISLAAKASDATPGDTFTYSLSGPVGASVNPSTGAITWTTGSSLATGQYTFAVKATDAAGQIVSTTFDVTVTAPINSVLNLGASEAGIGAMEAIGPATFSTTTTSTTTPTSTLTTLPSVAGSTYYAAPPSETHYDAYGMWQQPEQVVVKKANTDNADSDPSNGQSQQGQDGDTGSGQQNGAGGNAAQKGQKNKGNSSKGAADKKPSLQNKQHAGSGQGAPDTRTAALRMRDNAFALLAADELTGFADATHGDTDLVLGTALRPAAERQAWIARALLARRGHATTVGAVKAAPAAKTHATVAVAPQPVVEPAATAVAAKIAAPVAATALFLPMLVTETQAHRDRRANRKALAFWRFGK